MRRSGSPGSGFPDEVLSALRGARKVAALTGAGVSAESGIPTFRGEGGFWKDDKEVRAFATPEGYQRDPARVWEWYHARRRSILRARPNDAHGALAAMERRYGSFILITQNIDGLHRRAGSVNVLELHGDLRRGRCPSCTLTRDLEEGEEGIPACHSCRSPLRPDVVWFGEMLDPVVLEKAFSAASGCDLFLTVGTSGVVHPAATLPSLARRGGAFFLEVNAEATPLSAIANATILGKAGEILPALLEAAGAFMENRPNGKGWLT